MTAARDLPYCYPPHPSPSKPSFGLPANAVDAHFHIFGPPEVFPWSPPDQRVYTPPAAPLAHYHQLMAHLGIGRGVVVQPMAHGTDNAVTLDAIAHSGGRLMGVAKVDDTFSEADLERLHAGGIRGVRFNLHVAHGGTGDRELIETVVDRIRPLGWSVTFHARPDEIVANADWFAGLPVPVIIDHYARVRFADGTGQPGFRALVGLLGRHDHVWAKLSCIERCSAGGAPWDDAPPFAAALIEAAPDRLLWGTDWPHSQRYGIGEQCDTGALVDALPRLIPDAGLRRRILVENPLRLFPFEG